MRSHVHGLSSAASLFCGNFVASDDQFHRLCFRRWSYTYKVFGTTLQLIFFCVLENFHHKLLYNVLQRRFRGDYSRRGAISSVPLLTSSKIFSSSLQNCFHSMQHKAIKNSVDDNATVANRALSAGSEPELSTRSNRTRVLLSSAATTNDFINHIYIHRRVCFTQSSDITGWVSATTSGL